MNHVLRVLMSALACATFVQCPTPWHLFENPVDEDSPSYIGVPSLDHDGDGIPQYIDVDEIELAEPHDGAWLDTVTPELRIYRFKPSVVERYWIQISADRTFVSDPLYESDTLSDNVYTVPAGMLSNLMSYAWRAKAFDGTKWSSDWSEARSFAIRLDLGVPSDPAPRDRALVGDATPILDWADVPGADRYQIQIDEAASMAEPLLHDEDELASSSYRVGSVLANGTYYWRVRIAHEGQWGDWSPTWSFTVDTVPEIDLRRDGASIPSGTGSSAFGDVLLAAGGSTASFTIENLGTANLHLTGSPTVAIAGADAAMFRIVVQPLSPVSPSSSSALVVSFDPTSLGAKSATVTIANDDPDEHLYSFLLTGAGVTPEMDVKRGTTSIPSGGDFDFGAVLAGTSSNPMMLVIENSGSGALVLGGAPKVAITGADAAAFSVEIQPESPIAPSDRSGFVLVFRPASAGPKAAMLSIANSDLDESPYTVNLRGLGVAAGPEMHVKQGATDLPSGSGSYSFGSVRVGRASAPVEFTVDNSGLTELLLTASPAVTVTGADASMFVVVRQPESPVQPSATTVFTIVFRPTSKGTKQAVVSIENNDSDENPYTFEVTGKGT